MESQQIQGEQLKRFVADHGGVESLLEQMLKKAEAAERFEECSQIKMMIEKVKSGELVASIEEHGLCLKKVS